MCNDQTLFGTSNLAAHVRNCKFDKMASNSDVSKLFKKPNSCLSEADRERVRRAEVGFCVDGLHPFQTVEHSGFVAILQLFANLGAR